MLLLVARWRVSSTMAANARCHEGLIYGIALFTLDETE
jgi:hypothetical protein